MRPTEAQKQVMLELSEVMEAEAKKNKYVKRLPNIITIKFYNPLMCKHGVVRIEETGKDSFEVTMWGRPKRGKMVRLDKPFHYDNLEAAMERAKNYTITWSTTD